ncbi:MULTISPECIES: hypothetical protein [Alteromonas]|uniref:Uncharacterized protein n=1 Tax=Alteromonas hispanica TaxID=315421 RepID=A0A6L9MWA0_9ALTE|nr:MULTISPECIES: hypothetical protein [Alteromonas]APE06259.1 hypothetical protein BM528_11190 [Alteromonas sp. RW2A1]MAI64934.1 hypothetical protein [Alteromonas sp.]NDW22183.1 hypothetical protein [Alteromonas hispanica]
MVTSSAHGLYSLSLSQNTVSCDYSEGFNLHGVRELTRDVLSLTAHLNAWVLFQRPTETAGITHDAIGEMMAGYLAFQQAGCKAVGIVENSIFVHAGSPHRPSNLTMPFMIDKDEEKIKHWLSGVL